MEMFAGWISGIVENASFCVHEKYLVNIWTHFRQALGEDGYFRKNIYMLVRCLKNREECYSFEF